MGLRLIIKAVEHQFLQTITVSTFNLNALKFCSTCLKHGRRKVGHIAIQQEFNVMVLLEVKALLGAHSGAYVDLN